MRDEKKANQTLLFRYLQLNHRSRRGGAMDSGEPPPDFPPLESMVDLIWEKFQTVGSRHVPRISDEKPNPGQRYIVLLRRDVQSNSKAVLLRFCIYTGGESHGFAPKDLDAKEGSVSYQQVTDENGTILEPGIEFSVLMLGRVLLIQNRSGVGAARAVQHAIHWFGRMLFGAPFVSPNFVTVSPKSIADQIRDAGGVIGVSFGVAQVEDQNGTVKPLQGIHALEHKLDGDHSRIKVSARADETLDAEASLELLDAPEDQGLENVTLHLKDSQTIKGERMILSKHIKVPLREGVPDCDAVDKQLLKYLQDLMIINSKGEQSVNPDGHIGGKLKIVTIKAKN